jgi:hypothetical protein
LRTLFFVSDDHFFPPDDLFFPPNDLFFASKNHFFSSDDLFLVIKSVLLRIKMQHVGDTTGQEVISNRSQLKSDWLGVVRD